MTEKDWFIYLIETRQGSLYTGITTNVERRLQQHQQGKGAKYLRGRGPLTLVFSGMAGSRSRASQLEARIKQLSREQKYHLLDTDPRALLRLID